MIHGRVVKTYRKNRVRKVERDLVIGAEWQLEDALSRSEDSDHLNTSFVERLNLTIRRGSTYLHRRAPCHARLSDCLEDQLELLRCYYSFIRPDRGLKFGSETGTPAMQAGLTSRQLTWRDIVPAEIPLLLVWMAWLRAPSRRGRLHVGGANSS